MTTDEANAALNAGFGEALITQMFDVWVEAVQAVSAVVPTQRRLQ